MTSENLGFSFLLLGGMLWVTVLQYVGWVGIIIVGSYQLFFSCYVQGLVPSRMCEGEGQMLTGHWTGHMCFFHG